MSYVEYNYTGLQTLTIPNIPGTLGVYTLDPGSSIRFTGIEPDITKFMTWVHLNYHDVLVLTSGTDDIIEGWRVAHQPALTVEQMNSERTRLTNILSLLEEKNTTEEVEKPRKWHRRIKKN